MTEAQSTPAKKPVVFRTKDLNQAAFIWCQDGADLMNLQAARQGSNGTTVFFQFSLPISEEQLRELQLNYANGKTTVEPQRFIARQNNLRDLLHSSLGTQVSNKRGE